MTVPKLLALAHGIVPAGQHRCFYCGSEADEEYPVKVYVKSSFNGRNGVVAPGSPWVCQGCVLCLRESAPIVLLDGEAREGQMMRGYSWVVRKGEALAATKAHVDRLRSLCLDPPDPPFAIVISDSGQTHQLYRGVVNHDRDHVTVTLEAEPISYRPADLAERLELCGRLVAATGKPALKEPITPRFAFAVMERYMNGEALIDEWSRVREQPISRLAGWISPNKQRCQLEYPSDREPAVACETGADGRRGVPAKTGRTRRPQPNDGADRAGGGAGDRQATLFGPGAPVRGEP